MKRLLIFWLLLALPLWAEAPPELLLQTGHTDAINWLSWGPKGLLATGSSDGTAKVWDVDQKHLLATLAPNVELPSIKWVGWLSPTEVVTSTEQGLVRVYDWRTGALVRSFEIKDANHVGGNGPLLAATLSENGGVVVYSTATGKLERQFKTPANSSLGTPALSPDGQKLAVELFDTTNGARKLEVYSLADGSSKSYVGEVDQLVFSPDSQQLATASWGKLWLIDLASGQSSEKKLEGSANYLDWSNPDKLLVAHHASNYPAWEIWDPKTGNLLSKGPLETGAATITFLPHNKGMARSANGDVILMDPQGQKSGVLGGRMHRPRALLSDGSRLLVGLDIGTYLVFDTANGTLQGRLPVQEAYVSGAELSPDKKLLASCDPYNGVLHVSDPATGKEIARITCQNSRNVGPYLCCWSPDGKFLAVPSYKQLLVYQTGDWQQPWAKVDLTGGVNDLAWFGNTLTVINGKTVTDYDTTNWRQVRTLQVTGNNGDHLDLNCGLYLPNGDLWLGSGKSQVAIIRAGSTVPVVLNTSHTSTLRGITASPDGSLVVTTGDYGIIDLWDAKARKLLPTKIDTHGFDHYHPLILPDGRTLAATGDDYRVRFWDMTTGQDKGQVVIMDRGQNWIAAGSDGHFDGTAEGQRALEWRVGAERYRLEQFFEQFFKPGLLHDLAVGGKRAGASVAAAPKPPVLEVVSPAPGTAVKAKTTPVVVKVTERGGGASHFKLFANGHPVEGQRQGDQVTFQAPLSSGVNELRVTGYDGSGKVESRGDWVKVTCQVADERKPQMHVLACGIDKYPERPLRYARADAEAFVAPFASKGLFETVKPTLLLDEKATRANVLQSLSALAAASQPQDTLIIYLAGHGTTEGETYQFRCVDGQVLTSTELAQALEKIPASRQLLVLDTCHSGAASGDLAARFIRGQQRLARGSGTFLLAASRSDEAAAEVPGVRHGLLTFAVLRATQGAPLNPNKQLTANGLVQFASYDVEELARKYQAHQEVVQYSTGRDFPLLQK